MRNFVLVMMRWHTHRRANFVYVRLFFSSSSSTTGNPLEQEDRIGRWFYLTLLKNRANFSDTVEGLGKQVARVRFFFFFFFIYVNLNERKK